MLQYAPSTPAADHAIAVVIAALDALPTGERLIALRSLSALLGSRRASTVLAARGEGMSWQEIAGRLGMSRQSVWERFGVEEADAAPPARGRRPRPRTAVRTFSSCAAFKAVTTRPS